MDSGFQALDSGFQGLDSGFQYWTPASRYWIMDSRDWIPDSMDWIPDSLLATLGLRIPTLVGISDSLSCIPDSTSKNFSDSGIRIPSLRAIISCHEKRR